MSDSPLLKDTSDEDRLWFRPNPATDGTKKDDLLVYFIPGNPCLMLYYEPFLSSLAKLLNSGDGPYGQGGVYIGGSSLPGFQLSHPTIMKGTLPAGLTDQILNVEEFIVQALENRTFGHSGRRTKVILMAHSVGAYMTLEVLRRRAQHRNRLDTIDIIGAVLLFPTVTEIAQSPNGTVLSKLLYIPFFRAIVPAFLRMVTYLISVSTLSRIICRVGGVPRHTGKALAGFLKSPTGVSQALHLTLDGMRLIRQDSWDEAVWGSASELTTSKSQNQAVPLRFYFGEQDVWVSRRARNELIASRARRPSEGPETQKPVMVVDAEKIPHDFIVDHNERIAERAKAMIDDLRNEDQGRGRDI